MLKVWVLFVYAAGMVGHNLTTIDDISSRDECERLGQQLVATRINPDLKFRCFEVEKVSHPARPSE